MKVNPAVIIGLGGAGVHVARLAKRKLAERVGAPLIAYRFVDADANSFNSAEGLADVAVSEQCFIGGRQLLPLLEFPQHHDWVLKNLPRGLRVEHLQIAARGRGCAQNRGAGRIAFLASWATAKESFVRAVNAVRSLDSDVTARQQLAAINATVGQGVTVYVVSSLAGGTGSGCFVDAMLLARDVIGPTGKLIGIFMLPGTFESIVSTIDPKQRLRVQINSYAALKELQALRDKPWDRDVRFQTAADGSAITLGIDGAVLYDLCYLIDNKNQHGKQLSRPGDLYELVARLLLHENGTALGNYADSVEVNIGSLNGLERCPVSQRELIFSTFSLTALRYPGTRVLDYCVTALVYETLHDVLLGVGLVTKDIEQYVTAFLRGVRLDERGASNQLVDALLASPHSGERMTDAVTDGAGAKDRPSRFAARIHAELEQFRRAGLPKLAKAIDGNAIAFLGAGGDAASPLRTALAKSVTEWLRQCGSIGLGEILRCLVESTDAMRKELLRESVDWVEGQRKATLGEIERLLEELQRTTTIGRWLTSKDERLKQACISAVNDVFHGDVLEVARAQAVRILSAFEEWVRQAQDQVAVFVTEGRAAADALHRHLELLRAQEGRTGAGFVVEQDVTAPGHLNERLAELRALHFNGRPGSDPARQFVALLEDRNGDFFARLLEVGASATVNAMSACAREVYGPSVADTDIVSFVAGRLGRQAGLAARLEAMFDMCQPFWQTVVPQTNDRFFSEVVALGCGPAGTMDDGDPIFPEEVREWVGRLGTTALGGGSGANVRLVPAGSRQEIELVRYTHAARAFYLTEAKEWERQYLVAASRPEYGIHTHAVFDDVPNLAPDEKAVSKLAFAVGAALGFVAKRGEHYYLNLEARSDSDGRPYTAVLYGTEWPTALQVAAEEPPKGGLIRFELRATKPPRERHLGQGRGTARANLTKEQAEIILRAFDEYKQEVGTLATRSQLRRYAEHLGSYDVPGHLRRQIGEEARRIREFCAELE